MNPKINVLENSHDAGMTSNQARFIAEFSTDSNSAAAARRAGHNVRGTHVAGCRLHGDPKVVEALQASQAATAGRLVLDCQRVLPRPAEAVALASAKANVHDPIRAWSEIGWMWELYGF